MDGLLIIDKPAGPTSHDVVARVRRVLRERRIGHTGTLDPVATGVLPLVVGRATRLARFLSASDKAYEAVIRLGVATDTGDAHGDADRARASGDAPAVERDAIERRSTSFAARSSSSRRRIRPRRSTAQRSYDSRAVSARPSTGSGRASCRSARAEPVEPRARDETELTRHGAPTRDRRRRGRPGHARASTVRPGFYVRSLAHDLGERLGTGAHLAALRRTRSGDFTVDDAIAAGRGRARAGRRRGSG